MPISRRREKVHGERETRGAGTDEGWTIWIHKQNFGKSGWEWFNGCIKDHGFEWGIT